METTAHLVRSARRRASLTARELAALAGVSPSLVSRTENGKVSPAADAFRALLRAAGFVDAGGRLAPLSQPSALWTVRWMLGDLDSRPADADEWLATWSRIGLTSTAGEVRDVESLLFRAGRSAVLQARPGSVSLATPMRADEIGGILENAQVDYAISGDEALSRLGSPIVPSWPAVYVADIRDAVDAVGARPVLPAERGPRALLMPFDGASESGRAGAGGLRFVTAVQAVLDGYGGYGRMVEQAQYVASRWDRV